MDMVRQLATIGMGWASLSIALPLAAFAQPIGTVDAAIADASQRFDVPQSWIRAVIHAESRGIAFDNAGRPLISRAGAIGLMQVMPATYAAMARAYGLGADPAVPRDNILAGTAYLRLMYDRFGSPGFLAAYNAGPGRWERHLRTGEPLPGETNLYLATTSERIGTTASDRQIASPELPPGKLFARIGDAPVASRGALFFALRAREADQREAPPASSSREAEDR